MRAVQLYLRPAGRLAFVLPLAALSRGQYEKFRMGDYAVARMAFDEAWTMDENVSPLFPVPSCVVFGRRRSTGKRVPDLVRAYSGTLPARDSSEVIADKCLKITEGSQKPSSAKLEGGSVYRSAFRQGATLVPRMLCLVERKAAGKLGADPKAPLVVSRRSTLEKEPWKSLKGVEHKVEAEFLRPVLLGENVLPYRIFRPIEGVIPVDSDGAVLDAKRAADRGFSGLVGWMRAAEKIWNKDKPGDLSLVEQFDYYGKLASQFPVPKYRVVYAASGTIPAACLLAQQDAVIEHANYWSAVSTKLEAHFLIAISNSEAARARVANLQARGQFGARHFDKVMFTLPIPRFDSSIAMHSELAAAAAEAEKTAAKVKLPDAVKFQRARKLVRDALADAGIAPRIDTLVERLLDSQ